MSGPVIGANVCLRSANTLDPPDGWHIGTVTRVEGDRFRVTWQDSSRHRGEPRSRTWHSTRRRGDLRWGLPTARPR
jgi:hypothetical protein